MAMPFLATKLTIPPLRSSLVLRPRLIERLNAGRECRLTLIAAPAGFGKTTLLTDWLRHFGSPISDFGLTHPQAEPKSPIHNPKWAWLSLDERDDDPVRFWNYVIAALERAHAGIGNETQDLLNSPQALPIELVLTTLLNTLVALPQPITLFLDDYHLISNQAIHDGIVFLLDNLPPTLRLVIASRSSPPLPLARLRARNQLNELYAADLRFTNEEAATFLNQVMGLTLAADDIAALEARTEGWVAGLQLAALSLRAQTRDWIDRFTGSNRYILDYLTEEVLSRQSAPIRAFLLRTSILDRLSGDLCDQILLSSANQEARSNAELPAAQAMAAGSQTILDQLEQANLFLIPLDTDRHWYRYHHLFAEALRARLPQEIGNAEITRLQQRAALWHEAHGMTSEAIGYALAAGDSVYAIRMIEATAYVLMMRGELTTLRRWLAALPQETILMRSQLAIVHASTLLFDGNLGDAYVWADYAAHALADNPPTDPDAQRTQQGEIDAIKALALLGHEDNTPIVAHARQALAVLPTHHFMYMVAQWALGAASLFAGDVEQAKQIFSEAVARSRRGGNMQITMLALGQLADLQMFQGHLHQAAAIYRQAQQLASDPNGQPLPAASIAYIGISDVLREWNQLDAALESLDAGFELTNMWAKNGLFDAYTILAKTHMSRGDITAAFDAFQQLEQWLTQMKMPRRVEQFIGMHQAKLWLSQGDLAAAKHWAQTSRYMHEPGFIGDALRLTVARIALAEGRSDDALALLDQVRTSADASVWLRHNIEARVLQALAYQACGNTAMALEVLQEALLLAAPEGYIRIFVDEGRPIAELLAQIRKQEAGGKLQEYVQMLLDTFALNEKEAQIRDRLRQALPDQPVAVLIEPLTEREREILHLIADGRSNQAIAEQLVIALSTVKTHISNIYGKLDVRSRTQALVRARELGLL